MTKRESNVDLLRIIATVFVIMLHVLGGGGVLDAAEAGTPKYWIAWFLEIGAYCAVNCFALISGYVMINKSVKMKNILSLWLQVFLYSILFSSLFFIFRIEEWSLQSFIRYLFPVIGHRWWYISAYFGLFLFIPILNTAINNLSKKSVKGFLVIILIVVCVFDRIMETYVSTDAFILRGGASTIWLVLLYMFGAYIKKYDVKQKVTALKSILGFFSMILLTFFAKMVIYYLTKNIFGQVKYDGVFVSYRSITIVLAAVFIFLFCLRIKIGPFAQKIIAFFAPASLGIYLIHTHPFVYSFTMSNKFMWLVEKPIIVMILGAIGITAVIFLACAAIDWIRILLFKLVRINKLCEFIDNKIQKIYTKIF